MEKNKSPFNAAALTLGIISIVTTLFWYLSLPTGILGIIFGVKGTKRTGSKVAKAGMVTGIIGLSLCLFVYIAFTGMIIFSEYF